MDVTHLANLIISDINIGLCLYIRFLPCAIFIENMFLQKNYLHENPEHRETCSMD